MKDENCGYCMRGELLDKFGIYICDLEVSTLILFKEQSKKGRCIVAYKDHVSEIVDISDEERNKFFADVKKEKVGRPADYETFIGTFPEEMGRPGSLPCPTKRAWHPRAAATGTRKRRVEPLSPRRRFKGAYPYGRYFIWHIT